jgi:hypothetical protein
MAFLRSSILAGIAAVAVLCSVPAYAQSPDGMITGVVRDARGVPSPQRRSRSPAAQRARPGARRRPLTAPTP